LLVAGRAAHVAAREREAAAYYQRAFDSAQTAVTRIEAELGLIQVALELEDPTVHERLAALDTDAVVDPGLEVMVVDRKIGVETRFALPVDVARGRAARELLPLVDDPMVRTSFRNVFGYTLAAMFEFEEAETLTEEQLHDAARCRLDFVVPYATTVMALIRTGQRNYDAAAAAVAEVRERATATRDHAVQNVVLPVEARLWIAQGACDVVLALPQSLTSPVTRSLEGEYAACRAVALAGVGAYAEASRTATAALEASTSIEAQICANAALGICAFRGRALAAARSHTALALERALRSGMIECLVSVIRGFPDFAVAVLDEAARTPGAERMLQLAGVPATGGSSSEQAGSAFRLSPREREVLSLVAAGMTNRAIGEQLFISPVTVKVHVRNIFDKLGVRSRAEAALRAGQLPL
jgi:DNA-binding NarL/FixJ family response regulator